jgi:hypothetical protein
MFYYTSGSNHIYSKMSGGFKFHCRYMKLERSTQRYHAMTCSLVMGRKVGDILQILGGGLIPKDFRVFLS